MGIVRTMARAVVHGPLRFQGLDIPNLYTEQLIARLQTLLQYGSQPEDVTGSMIRYTAEAFRLELGVAGELFEAPAALAAVVTDSWIKACWLDMVTHDIHIKSDIPDFKLPRAGDGEIMLAFLKAGFHTEELATLNR